MKQYITLLSASFALVMLMASQMASAQGKRISRMEYDGEYVELYYNDQDRVETAYDSEFGMQHFTYEADRAYTEWLITTGFTFYDGTRLSGIIEDESMFAFEWNGDVITRIQEIEDGEVEDEGELTYYDRECNVPALSHALAIMAGVFAEPEELAIIYGCYALKDYFGTPVRKLVKTSHLREGIDDEYDHWLYDVTYDYDFDSDGYVTEVKMHVEQENWRSGSSYKHNAKDESINIYWEPTTGIKSAVDSRKTKGTVYTLSGQKLTHKSAGVLRPGVYVVDGRKIAVK